MAIFIYNRTQNHVDRLKQLRAKGYENLTASERADYAEYASLGAYNSSDLNRVESAVGTIATALGLTLTTRTWGMWVSPTAADMDRYLGNVVAVRDAALARDATLEFPALPISMEYLTFEGANNIEKILEIVYNMAGQMPTILDESKLDTTTLS